MLSGASETGTASADHDQTPSGIEYKQTNKNSPLASPRFATFTVGNHQYTVKVGDLLTVDYLGDGHHNSDSGDNKPEALSFDTVQMLGVEDGTVHVGQPYVPGASVRAEVATATRAPKILVFKKKRRKKYRRLRGHKQPLSKIVVTEIQYHA
ncbi:MAG: 50S ribosomal protein L21 [Proteobacteria bacterium]|nr:50S ribosomal protein L21 [Pseudomonadota bacterium]